MTHTPFEAFTLIAAPALLTNATCVLAMGTVNRMLRTRDRMHELFVEGRKNAHTEAESIHFLRQVSRVERQAIVLLQALGSIYVALASFAGGTLMTLIGGGVGDFLNAPSLRVMLLVGIGLVFLGVACLIFGSIRLFQATRISLSNLRAEANLLRDQSRLREVNP
jgi:hypothetical protein